MDEPEYVDLQKYYDKTIKTTILDNKNKNSNELAPGVALHKRRAICQQ